jgi:hypothetical protein
LKKEYSPSISEWTVSAGPVDRIPTFNNKTKEKRKIQIRTLLIDCCFLLGVWRILKLNSTDSYVQYKPYCKARKLRFESAICVSLREFMYLHYLQYVQSV